MNIIFLLIPLSLVLLGVAIAAFFWAMKHDQFDDLEGPAYSIFNEDDPKPGAKSAPAKQDAQNQQPPQHGAANSGADAPGHSNAKPAETEPTGGKSHS